MTLSDSLLNASPTFQRAKSLGVRTMPLTPTKDTRPSSLSIILSGFLFFGVLIGVLGFVMGVGR